jgi:hypothetical protein
MTMLVNEFIRSKLAGDIGLSMMPIIPGDP